MNCFGCGSYSVDTVHDSWGNSFCPGCYESAEVQESEAEYRADEQAAIERRERQEDHLMDYLGQP